MSTIDTTDRTVEAPDLRTRYAGAAAPISLAGSVLLIISAFMSWSYNHEPLSDVTYYGNPAPTQYLAIVMGLAGVLMFLGRGPLASAFGWFDTTRALRGLGIGTLAFGILVVLSITFQTSGVINVDPGGWVTLVAGALVFAGGWLMPEHAHGDPLHSRAPGWVEILIIIFGLAGTLLTVAYALNLNDGGEFVTLLAFLGAIIGGLAGGGFFMWLTVTAQQHRTVLMLGAAAVAITFPLTQNGSDANMSIAAQVLIFATTALGLNIVVGLAGLLDLGYIAFLGAGSYVGAMMSAATSATIGWHPPFIVVMAIGACVSATLGLIIGSPTLRVSGDYLAIVTLAFGEIFRITVNNLDGNNGPDLTHGPNGIAGIPDLNLFGFNFGTTHFLGSFAITRFANYYLLLLVVATLVITVFVRLNNSRIGRGWVAIREDERAAEAMGVNVFGLKIFAFAGGAFLAGMAGTVNAHLTQSTTPDQFIFLESAFLLAAVVLGGMGTVAGVLLGATILKLMPEKLRFLNNFRLLMFGILLVLMMRWRPEGIVPSRRRALEFHKTDEHLADFIQEEHDVEKGGAS
jgi:branched-chain amino acid transport system permease protein